MHEQTIPAFNTREDLQVNLSILSPKLGIIPAGKRDWWQLKGENLTFRYSVHIISSDKKNNSNFNLLFKLVSNWKRSE